jgi:anti-anti-sigma factor
MNKHLKILCLEVMDDYLLLNPVSNGAAFRYADLQMESNAVRAMVVQQRGKNMIIDLGNLNYFGSEFIGALIMIAREKKNQSGKVAVCNANPQMKDVLENMSLFKLWPYFSTRTEAIDFIIPPTSTAPSTGSVQSLA